MFSASQQVLKNRRRLSVLSTLQRKITEKKGGADRFAMAKEQTKKLREFFEDLQVEENRLQREIHEIAQKINRLEHATKSDGDACKNRVK